jgi:hypothetical protein
MTNMVLFSIFFEFSKCEDMTNCLVTKCENMFDFNFKVNVKVNFLFEEVHHPFNLKIPIAPIMKYITCWLELFLRSQNVFLNMPNESLTMNLVNLYIVNFDIIWWPFFWVKYLNLKSHLWVFSLTKRSRKRDTRFCYGRVHSIVKHHKNCNQYLFYTMFNDILK